MKKPGLLKRIFSFGKTQQTESTEEIAVDEKPADTATKEPTANLVDAEERDDGKSPPGFLEIDSLPKHSGAAIDTIPFEYERSKSVEGAKADPVKGKENDLIDTIAGPQQFIEETSQPAPSLEGPSATAANDDPARDAHIVVKSEITHDNVTHLDEEQKSSWFKRLSRGLSRSSSQLSDNISAVFTRKKLDDAALEDLEDVLLQADLGFETTMNIVDSLAKQRLGKNITDEEVRTIMAEEIEKVLAPVAMPLELDLECKPHVILVVGVNGSGKTTTIGKLSQKLFDSGYTTMLAAGDTFRAAAIEQLKIWGERTGSMVVARTIGSDSAGLAYDAWHEAKDADCDVLMMDTAGRLQNKIELMAELEKIIRVLKKLDPTAPHTVLLTLDATTGQNALSQVEIFGKVAGVNGLIMTKLDGSARGGILVSISAKFKLPVYFIGVGEQVEDLEPFEAQDFARSLAGLNS